MARAVQFGGRRRGWCAHSQTLLAWRYRVLERTDPRSPQLAGKQAWQAWQARQAQQRKRHALCVQKTPAYTRAVSPRRREPWEVHLCSDFTPRVAQVPDVLPIAGVSLPPPACRLACHAITRHAACNARAPQATRLNTAIAHRLIGQTATVQAEMRCAGLVSEIPANPKDGLAPPLGPGGRQG